MRLFLFALLHLVQPEIRHLHSGLILHVCNGMFYPVPSRMLRLEPQKTQFFDILVFMSGPPGSFFTFNFLNLVN
jgi:hypothetical protein